MSIIGIPNGTLSPYTLSGATSRYQNELQSFGKSLSSASAESDFSVQGSPARQPGSITADPISAPVTNLPTVEVPITVSGGPVKVDPPVVGTTAPPVLKVSGGPVKADPPIVHGTPASPVVPVPTTFTVSGGPVSDPSSVQQAYTTLQGLGQFAIGDAASASESSALLTPSLVSQEV